MGEYIDKDGKVLRKLCGSEEEYERLKKKLTSKYIKIEEAQRRIEELCKKFNISYGAESANGFGAELAHLFDAERWIGENFLDWCEANEDDRKINYTLVGKWGGEKHKESFTSEDAIDMPTMLRIRSSEIVDMRLENNEWYFTIEFYSV